MFQKKLPPPAKNQGNLNLNSGMNSGGKRLQFSAVVKRFVLTRRVTLCPPAGSSQAELCRSFLTLHESCREHGATPSQYMSFLHVYTEIYSRKKSQLTTRQQHLQVAEMHDARRRAHNPTGGRGGFVYFPRKKKKSIFEKLRRLCLFRGAVFSCRRECPS